MKLPGSQFSCTHPGRSSPDVAWPIILPFIGSPKSAVDFGCGTGHWLAALKRVLPSVEILGLNSSERTDAGTSLSPEEFCFTDLTKPVRLNRTFDVAICVEVAEHLPPSAANTIVDSITSHANAVVFAAAIPGQRGDHHVNEQWPSYWIARFAEHDFQCFDRIRPLVWLNDDIATWYRQNIMLFLRSPRVPEIDGDDWHGMPFVHPEYFNLARARPRRTPFNLLRFIVGREMR